MIKNLVDLRPRRDHENMLPAPRFNTEWMSQLLWHHEVQEHVVVRLS